MGETKLKAGDHISFVGSPEVFEITDDYKQGVDIIKKCDADCTYEHDHYEEDYVVIRNTSRTMGPISTIRFVFDNKTYIGKEFIQLL